MRLALECRTDLLGHVQPFSDFDWILTHKVLEDEEYTQYYKGTGKLKFIDNSVNEMGEPSSVEDMKKALDLVGDGIIVAPDFYGDAQKTLEAYGQCVELFGEDKVAGVLQGNNFREALDLVDKFGGLLAVPYDIGSQKSDPPWLMSLRRILVVSHIPSDRYIHLLGFTSLDEFEWYKDNPRILSVDTGMPVLLGLQGLDILDPIEDKSEPTFNLMDKHELTPAAYTAIVRNIALLRRYLP